MFYSQTILARKGPLGTVWCAAHLQHKLKKSHVSSTDIPSTVERIIYPEVPIALRLSSHLLLGVVRIYSKKVDYLHHDCNILRVSLLNAFRPVDVNLPENASQAQFNAITLPETYALDALDIDEDLSLLHGSPDNHLRSQDEITLRDQNLAESERELYVRITFDDDIIQDSSRSMASSHREAEPMQIDSHRVIEPRSPGARDLGPSLSDRLEGESAPDFEIMRDRPDDDIHMTSPILRPHVAAEPNISPPKDTTEKDIETPLSVHLQTPQRQPTQSPQHSGPSPPFDGGHTVSDTFVDPTSNDLVLRPSPSPERPQPSPERPQPQRRRKRQFFDETLSLTNAFVKRTIDDPSDLVKKRKKLPCSALEMWRFTNKRKKEQMFSEPVISGMSVSLENILCEDLVSLNPNLLVPEEAQPDHTAAEFREPANSAVDIEHLRSPYHDPEQNFESLFPFSSPRSSPQPHVYPESSSSPRIPSMITEPRFASTGGSQSDQGMFTRSTVSGMETPVVNFDERNDNVSTGLSDIPEWENSMASDDLSFLEQDTNTPPDSQGAEGDTMSVRTRAVAQYLKNCSPLSKFSDDPSEELSLNTILEGRSRKLCARMFYETLVLKDCGLIDVRQDKPYGDITLKLTPRISTAKL